MRSIITWWRETIPWPWRWLCGAAFFVALCYLVEDIRGAWAWRSFLAENPEYRYFNDPEKSPDGAKPDVSNFLLRRVNEVPEALKYYQADERFQYLSVDRTKEYLYTAGAGRHLEFPLAPFRRCGNWHPSSLWKAGSKVNEINAAKIILGDGDLFSQFEKDRGAEIRSRLQETGIPQSEFDYEIKLYIRCLLWRSLARLRAGEKEQAVAALHRALEMIDHFDDGTSVVRSNDVVEDLMNALQLVWELAASEALNQAQLTQLQAPLQSIAYEKSANEAAHHFALEACRDLDQHKWDLKRRWLRTGAYQTIPLGSSFQNRLRIFLLNLRWKAYVLFMPNGWIDHNKAYLCRRMAFPETPPGPNRFNVHNALAAHLYNYIHRFDPRPMEAFRRCAVLAVATERFRLEKERFPHSPRALVPEFIGMDLLDPFDRGKPLKFGKDPAGRLFFYSVGPDGKDDGGTPRAPIKEGDLAWRYQLPEGFVFDDYIIH